MKVTRCSKSVFVAGGANLYCLLEPGHEKPDPKTGAPGRACEFAVPKCPKCGHEIVARAVQPPAPNDSSVVAVVVPVNADDP